MLSIGGIVSLAITLIVLAVVVWLVDYLVRSIPIADPPGRVIRIVTLVICVLIAIIVLLQFAGLMGPVGTPILRP